MMLSRTGTYGKGERGLGEKTGVCSPALPHPGPRRYLVPSPSASQGTATHPAPLGCGTASEGSGYSQTKHRRELAPSV